MWSDSTGFESLLREVQDGSEQATRQLFERYGQHVLRAVRRRLARSLRSRFDSQDFCQAVWLSIFTDPQVFARFRSPDAFIAYLTRVATNKVIDAARRPSMAERPGSQRELTPGDSCCSLDQLVPATNQPAACDVAVANEEWRRLVADQPEVYEEVLWLRAQGLPQREIAHRVGLSARSVRRIVSRLKSLAARR